MFTSLRSVLSMEKLTTRFARKHILFSLVGVAVLAGLAGFFLRGGAQDAAPETVGTMREVRVASVAELSQSSTPLPAIGTVRSQSEATILAEASGQITVLNKKIGDYVAAGSVIAELENSAQRASVAQAKAGVKSAEAGAGIAQVAGEREQGLLNEAKIAAVNTLESAYDSVDDSIRSKTDAMFINPRTQTPKFIVLTSNEQLITNIQFERLKVQEILDSQAARRGHISTSADLDAELNRTASEVRYLNQFLTDIVAALNVGIPTTEVGQSTIDSFKLAAGGARGVLNGTLASLSGAKDNLTAKTAQYQIAQKQYGDGGSGNTTSDAALAQAQAALNVATVALEKTIVRAPISGILNSLSIDRGDFVSPFQPVAVVSNNGALEIVTYVTEEDVRDVRVGGVVEIEGGSHGVITKILGALDPQTRKIEVRVGITSRESTLVNGQNISLSLTRVARTIPSGTALTIPISALKITPSGPVVFTVDEKNTLQPVTVTTGALLGEKITITSGLTPEMEIVTDVRGLKADQEVTIAH